ncbi:restriction endonuclease subunit S [Aeromonas rivipollensis]|uniref:Restriction endonuclease subunit S n=1 Tax=Aeromonas salmonicida TaxID=645 RepID=A0AAX3W039_AERSA|nr:restriction endonuclease subunit S [Aeromonas salmonicida]WHF38162.1 restriction endonuclease subunit S [Aeromonas salmonicida]
MAEQMMQNNAGELVANKAIPVGYKQTEVGVIPKDWQCLKIEEVCHLINGRGFKPFEWGAEGLPIIRIQNLNGSEEYNFYAGSYDSKIEIDKGQLLFAWSGSRGTSFGPHIWHGPKSLLNYHTWKIVIKNDQLESKYFFYALKGLTKSIEDAAHGASALVHTQMGEMKKFWAPVPNNILEQVAISNVLSDTDALIVGLELLVAKKQAIKSATMQQLLTGRTRLPAFALRPDGTPKGYKPSELGEIPEDWELLRLGSCCHITTGKKDVNEGSQNGEYPFFTCSRNYTYSSSFSFDLEAILIAGNGEVGNLHYYNGKFEAYQRTYVLHGFIFGVWFVWYQLEFKLSESLGLGKIGSTIPYIKKGNLTEFKFFCPSLDAEQTAIATILSDMDNELQALTQKLDKARALKQGMMQQLLTGKIRLPLAAGA